MRADIFENKDGTSRGIGYVLFIMLLVALVVVAGLRACHQSGRRASLLASGGRLFHFGRLVCYKLNLLLHLADFAILIF